MKLTSTTNVSVDGVLPRRARLSLNGSRYRRDQRLRPDWPAPETVRDHGGWELCAQRLATVPTHTRHSC